MPNGGSLCSVESTRRYCAHSHPNTAWLGNGDPNDVCCSELFTYIHCEGGEWENKSFGMVNNDDNTDCLWLSGEIDSCGSAELEIISATEAVLTITMGGAVLVWNADSGYNPLCISGFTYSSIDSTNEPTDCSWPEQFCIVPSESCCPNYGYPDTLYATITPNPAPGACPDWEYPAVIELTRFTPNDPSYYGGGTLTAVRWEGSGEVYPGGSTIDIVLSCVASNPNPYRMFMDFPVTGCAPDSEYADETTTLGFSSCDPFVFTFTDIQSAFNCCVGLFDMDIVVTE